ncbi:MAG: helix-turn-helix domain-containing protein [Ruminococcus sp.]|nr:helix-turn-helix domain-containing protein [Ruminococcus sp.]
MSNTISMNMAYNLMFKSYPEVVGIDDICKMLNIGRNKAYQLVNSGILKRIPCSREIKIAKITVINYVLQSTQ